MPDAAGPIIICETPKGCACGAPGGTPAGMHHCDCAVHPGWCGQPSCLPCQENGQVDRECSHCPPGCRSCEPIDCECYTHQDEPDRRVIPHRDQS